MIRFQWMPSNLIRTASPILTMRFKSRYNLWCGQFTGRSLLSVTPSNPRVGSLLEQTYGVLGNLVALIKIIGIANLSASLDREIEGPR